MPDTDPLLRREDTGIIFVDVQEPLLRAIWNADQVVAGYRLLATAAKTLGLAGLVPEQNPDKLGPTAAVVADAVADLPHFGKLTFSCCAQPELMAAIRASGRRTWLLCGAETHVCIAQTALDLLAQGYRVQVVADAVGSRTEANWRVGLDRIRAAGGVVTSVEMAIFELLRQAGTDDFRALLKLFK